MVVKKGTKKESRNLMIKVFKSNRYMFLVITLILIVSGCSSQKNKSKKDNLVRKSGINTTEQLTNKLVDYFDLDGLKDTLTWTLKKGTIGPVYGCTIKLGNGKVVNFDIPVGKKPLVISRNGKGSFTTTEWVSGTAAVSGYSITTTYKYDQNLHDWFQTSSKRSKTNNDEETITHYTKQWSVDETILKIKGKNTLLSLYEKINSNFEEKEYDTIKALAAGVTNLQNTPHLKENIQTYNDIAYYLQQAGANKEAVIILEKIIAKFPDRTVAYINLGDAYWGLNNKHKAREAYQTYTQQMEAAGKASTIPERVIKRLK